MKKICILQIKKLIKNKKFLIKSQKKNYKNFFLDHKYVTSIIDKLRKEFILIILNIN